MRFRGLGLVFRTLGADYKLGWCEVMNNEKNVLIRDEYDIVCARSVAEQMAAEIGLGIGDQSRLATAVSELAQNIVRHAGGGVVDFQQICQEGKSGLEIVAVDSGPGIPDMELAMQDGYTTGEGSGEGLPSTKRLVDEFEIDSRPGMGTTVTIRKWKS